jgi:uncharacterized hydrophobic protein (TIGR00271 family)
MPSSEWINKNRFDPSYLPIMEGKLFFEGDTKIRSTTNYIVLLTLATVIATYGVITGSTASVIGAMIIAPLMTPIMATTLAIVLGAISRTRRSVLLVSLSVLYVIGLAIVLSIFISSIVIGFDSNPEITSRVSPNLLALFIALASGAAGAFAVSREDVGDTLPGVAIAISLVPPLAVVGIAMSKAQWLDAGGALLLFLTNFLAIVLAGGAVFWFSGVSVRRVSPLQDIKRKRAIQIAIVGMMVVAILLGFNGYRTLEQERDTTLAQNTVIAWLNGTSYTVSSVTLNFHPEDFAVRGPSHVRITIAGRGDMPDIEQLAQSLERTLGYPVTIEMRAVPEEVEYYPIHQRFSWSVG